MNWRAFAGPELLALLMALTVVRPAQAQQAFPTGVELIAVDVTVVDREGSPLSDLAVADFELRVGGKPRRVVSAQLVRYAPPATPLGQLGAPRVRDTRTVGAESGAYSTNREAQVGRLIVLVPDVGSLSVGGAKVLADAAGRFLSRLTPRDRVALLTIPTGPKLDFTNDYGRVAEALQRLMGTPASRGGGFYHVSLAEAFARFAPAGDRRIWCAAVEREVEGMGVSGGSGREDCPSDPMLDSEARRVYDTARSTAAATKGSLLGLLRALAKIEGPKTVVLLSQGLVTGTSGGDPGGNRRLAEVADAAAAARASVYTIQADRSMLESMDAQQEAMAHSPGLDQQLLADGLEAIAGYTGGPLLKTTTTPNFAFERVASETSASWLLSFEPEQDDRDGKFHSLQVKVARPGVEVRARPRFVVPAKPAVPESAEAHARRALDALLLESDVPLSVAAFALHDKEGEIRLVVAAEAGLAPELADTAAVGYRLLDAQGRLAAGAIDTGRLDRLRSPGEDTLYYLATVTLKPGTYVLKLAAATPSGRTGSVERVVEARLRPAGSLRLSDLVLAEPERRASGQAVSVDGRLLGRTSRVLVEVLAAPGEAPPSVQYEVAAAGEPGPRIVANATMRATTEPRSYAAEAVLDLTSLASGAYEIRAVVLLADGTEAARIARSVELPPMP